MKKSLQFFAIVTLLAIATVGCKPKVYGPIAISKPGMTGNAGKGNEVPSGLPQETPGQGVFGQNVQTEASPHTMNEGTHDPDILKAEMINFDVDSSTIKNSEKGKLKKVADYMKKNPTHDILVEGHCDERGTEAYNLALGDKRALAAREYLVSLGANADNIYTQSFGETRPIEPLHAEAAYSKNRRCEFVVVLPAK